MRVVNFAHGEFAMLGGFALYYLYAVLQAALAARDRARSPLLVALPSLLLEWLVFRWFYQKMFQSMIGLLGLSMVMIYTVADRVGRVRAQHSRAPSTAILRFGGVIVPIDRLVTIGISLARARGRSTS